MQSRKGSCPTLPSLATDHHPPVSIARRSNDVRSFLPLQRRSLAPPPGADLSSAGARFMYRLNPRPIKPATTNQAPATISQCGYSISESHVISLSISAPARPGGGWLQGGRVDRSGSGASRQAAWPCRAERGPLPAPRERAAFVVSWYHELIWPWSRGITRASRGEAYERNFHSALTPNHEGRIKMAKAKSVHSTPPTNTSAIDYPHSPTKLHAALDQQGYAT